MVKSILWTFCVIFFLCLFGANSYGQSTPTNDCNQLNFETKIIPSEKGRSSGSILFSSPNDDKARYKIFLLNKGENVARKEISSRRIESLSPGHYEFILIDTKVKGCFREVSVTVQELTN